MSASLVLHDGSMSSSFCSSLAALSAADVASFLFGAAFVMDFKCRVELAFRCAFFGPALAVAECSGVAAVVVAVVGGVERVLEDGPGAAGSARLLGLGPRESGAAVDCNSRFVGFHARALVRFEPMADVTVYEPAPAAEVVVVVPAAEAVGWFRDVFVMAQTAIRREDYSTVNV